VVDKTKVLIKTKLMYNGMFVLQLVVLCCLFSAENDMIVLNS